MGWAYNIAIAVAVVAGSALSGPLAFGAYAAGPTVGMVSKVENQAQIDGQPAAVGSPVHTNDTVSTGAISPMADLVGLVPIADLAHERWGREIQEGEFADKGPPAARLEVRT